MFYKSKTALSNGISLKKTPTFSLTVHTKTLPLHKKSKENTALGGIIFLYLVKANGYLKMCTFRKHKAGNTIAYYILNDKVLEGILFLFWF